MLGHLSDILSRENKSEEAESEARRDFMKKVAAGTFLTGVYAALPTASAFSISSEDPIRFFNSTSSEPNLEIKESGETDFQENNIVNAERVEASEMNLSDSEGSGKTIVYDSELDSLVVVDE